MEKKTVYIANVSKPNHLFCYHARADHAHGKLIELMINSGTQIKLVEPPEVMEKIINRYQRFGMVEARTVGRVQRFSGLVFQYDHEMNIDQLKEALERKRDIEDEQANDIRQLAVAGDHQRAQEVASEVGLPDIKVTSEVEERKPDNGASQSIRPLKQKLTVDIEGGVRRRANA